MSLYYHAASNLPVLHCSPLWLIDMHVWIVYFFFPSPYIFLKACNFQNFNVYVTNFIRSVDEDGMSLSGQLSVVGVLHQPCSPGNRQDKIIVNLL